MAGEFLQPFIREVRRNPILVPVVGIPTAFLAWAGLGSVDLGAFAGFDQSAGPAASPNALVAEAPSMTPTPQSRGRVIGTLTPTEVPTAKPTIVATPTHIDEVYDPSFVKPKGTDLGDEAKMLDYAKTTPLFGSIIEHGVKNPELGAALVKAIPQLTTADVQRLTYRELLAQQDALGEMSPFQGKNEAGVEELCTTDKQDEENFTFGMLSLAEGGAKLPVSQRSLDDVVYIFNFNSPLLGDKFGQVKLAADATCGNPQLCGQPKPKAPAHVVQPAQVVVRPKFPAQVVNINTAPGSNGSTTTTENSPAPTPFPVPTRVGNENLRAPGTIPPPQAPQTRPSASQDAANHAADNARQSSLDANQSSKQAIAAQNGAQSITRVTGGGTAPAVAPNRIAPR